jgi:hypothetical protein
VCVSVCACVYGEIARPDAWEEDQQHVISSAIKC